MLAQLRPLYNKFIGPLGKLSSRLGLTANAWTLFSLLLSFGAAYLLFLHEYWWGLAGVIAMYLADAMDGATARASGTATKFGTVFDHTIDRYAEFAVISGLLFGGSISSVAAMFCASGVIMASYVRAKAESVGGLKECTVGIAGRAEKLILIYGAIILLGLSLPKVAEIFIYIAGAISHITAVQRLLYTRARSK
jgi:phosphatidylglycerophosphate synthase